MNWEEKSDWMKIITSQENIMNTSCYSNQVDNWIAVQWSSMLFLWILKSVIEMIQYYFLIKKLIVV